MHPTDEVSAAVTSLHDTNSSFLTIDRAWGHEVVYVAACQIGGLAACHRHRTLPVS